METARSRTARPVRDTYPPARTGQGPRLTNDSDAKKHPGLGRGEALHRDCRTRDQELENWGMRGPVLVRGELPPALPSLPLASVICFGHRNGVVDPILHRHTGCLPGADRQEFSILKA